MRAGWGGVAAEVRWVRSQQELCSAARHNWVEKASAKKLPLKLSPEGQQQMKQLLAASKTKKLLVKPEGNGAISETNAALAISPAEAATLSPTELARRYAATQDWDRAIEQMQRAIAQEPLPCSNPLPKRLFKWVTKTQPPSYRRI